MANFKIRTLPKISLHDHLDGGLRPQTILDLAAEIGYELPADNAKELGEWFHKAASSGSLPEYLECFDHTIAVMQTPAALKRIAKEYVLDLANDGVIYGEVRWAPEQHLRNGLSLDEVVDAVQDGLEEGANIVDEQGGYIRTGQIITAMRHADRALEIAELAVRHRADGVVGFDIAGAENGFPASKHKAAFDYLASELMPVTVHAGEADGVESVKDALISGRALRLGHGVRISEDIILSREEGDTDYVSLGPVARWVFDRQIPLELCPSSNLQTGAISEWGEELEDHPFDLLYELGFKVTVSVDNRLLGRTTLTRELENLADTFGYGIGDIEQFQMNAAAATFQDFEAREELMEMIAEGFARAGNRR